MAITNYGELKAKIARVVNRRDLTNDIPDFIRAAHVKLVEAVGPVPEMADDTDTNPLLNYNPFFYVNGASAEAFSFMRDDNEAAKYRAMFQADLQTLYAAGGYDHLVQTPINMVPRVRIV